MANDEKMEFAYCLELGDIVDIGEARRRFNDPANNLLNKFTFYCPDPSCVQPDGRRTEIIATHHTKPPQDTTKHAACFRRYPLQHHISGCAWQKIEANIRKSRNDDIPGEDFAQQYRNKPTEADGLIDIFIRPSLKQKQHAASNIFSANTGKPSHPSFQSLAKPAASEQHQTKRSSGRLHKLVNNYVVHQKSLRSGNISQQQFDLLGFSVKNEGNYLYKDFFRLLTKIWDVGSFHGVYMANSRYNLSAGGGFSLLLQDEISDKKVAVYVL